MSKEDQYHRNNETISFEDADYQQDMRVDPLTTRQEIREELNAIQASKDARQKEAKAQAEAEKAEEQERQEYERLTKKFTDEDKAQTTAE